MEERKTETIGETAALCKKRCLCSVPGNRCGGNVERRERGRDDVYPVARCGCVKQEACVGAEVVGSGGALVGGNKEICVTGGEHSEVAWNKQGAKVGGQREGEILFGDAVEGGALVCASVSRVEEDEVAVWGLRERERADREQKKGELESTGKQDGTYRVHRRVFTGRKNFAVFDRSGDCSPRITCD